VQQRKPTLRVLTEVGELSSRNLKILNTKGAEERKEKEEFGSVLQKLTKETKEEF